MEPLTERALDQLTRELERRQGAGSCAAQAQAGQSRPHVRDPQMARYFHDLLNVTQENLPTSPLASRAVLPVAGPERAEAPHTAQQQQQQQQQQQPPPPAAPRSARRGARKVLHIPGRTTADGTERMAEGEVPRFGAIQAQPAGSRARLARGLAIFNRGKAVASSGSAPPGDAAPARDLGAYGSVLLRSLDDCIGEAALDDDPLLPVLRSSSNWGRARTSMSTIDLSILFDPPNTGSSSLFNVHNSLSDVDGFGASLFASTERLGPRCIGDVTTSDLGATRHSSRPVVPVPSAPAWPALGAGSRSIDTLPEYAPQSELPPSYPSMYHTPLESFCDPPYDAWRLSRSRASSGPLRYSAELHQHRASQLPRGPREPPGIAARGRSLTDSRDLPDICRFPRRMH
ncbi:hypothetical protein H4R18_000143 [Coemansia javaensis]|uniref:Uncharacterized protein n=1 Tax=Coemansia javaensis TaxID=2761396 RepID=A0A9W8LNA7_9FUNG|nr:hypothetical protein H4R18_000143 [Coemansia javaensis]